MENFIFLCSGESYLDQQFGVIPNMCITFGIAGKNYMKNSKVLSWDIWVVKFSCDQAIKAIGLILPHNIFGITIKFFSSVAN